MTIPVSFEEEYSLEIDRQCGGSDTHNGACRLSAIKGFLFGFVLTFFPVFDVPVFWPILVLYWFVLFFLTMKRQIKHMIKYRYVPFSFGKKVTSTLTLPLAFQFLAARTYTGCCTFTTVLALSTCRLVFTLSPSLMCRSTRARKVEARTASEQCFAVSRSMEKARTGLLLPQTLNRVGKHMGK